MKTTKQKFNSGWYGGVKLLTTYNELEKQFGKPTYDGSGDGKVNYEWVLETELGEVITIYDWKEYRDFGKDENIWWHIGVTGPTNKTNLMNELKEHFATVKEDR